jgi:hypothetical protein
MLCTASLAYRVGRRVSTPPFFIRSLQGRHQEVRHPGPVGGPALVERRGAKLQLCAAAARTHMRHPPDDPPARLACLEEGLIPLPCSSLHLQIQHLQAEHEEVAVLIEQHKEAAKERLALVRRHTEEKQGTNESRCWPHSLPLARAAGPGSELTNQPTHGFALRDTQICMISCRGSGCGS